MAEKKLFKRKFTKGDRVEIKTDTVLYGYGIARTKGVSGTIQSYEYDSIYIVHLDKSIGGLTSGKNNRCYMRSSKMKDAHEYSVELL